MRYLVGGLFAGFVIVLAIGAIRGRVRVRSCCAVADPTRDLRMRGAAPMTSWSGTMPAISRGTVPAEPDAVVSNQEQHHQPEERRSHAES
jgi:hypothetical protein